jgi:hypothetical protein
MCGPPIDIDDYMQALYYGSHDRVIAQKARQNATRPCPCLNANS